MQRSNERVAKFYSSKEWRRVRKAYKVYRKGVCERCGNAGTIVHHKQYINTGNINDTGITLSFNNLELLCIDCHNKEHFEKENMFDEEGQLIPPEE